MSAPCPLPPGGWPVLPERTLGWGGVAGVRRKLGPVGKGRRGLSRRPPELFRRPPELFHRQRGLIVSPGAQAVPSRWGAYLQVTP